MIYSGSHYGGLELCCGGLDLQKRPWRRECLPADVYFENCFTKPCQVGHRPFECSAMITTSDVRRYLR